MEREEPKLTNTDLSDVEFRPRVYRGPTHPQPRSNSDGLAWKIGVAVGIAVLAALLIFNAYERYQARKDAEQALQALDKMLVDAQQESNRTIRAMIQYPVSHVSQVPVIKPIPPGYRCSNGTLLYREGSGWLQITARSHHMYCPLGGTVKDCYYVTPESVGCRT